MTMIVGFAYLATMITPGMPGMRHGPLSKDVRADTAVGRLTGHIATIWATERTEAYAERE
jgi:hypothetical protein